MRNSTLRDEKYITSFGKHLRRQRKKKGLSMQELAASVYMEKNSLYRIENGLVNCTISTAKAIADALNLHPTALFDFK
jgi:transcriptional regulator with XRE-family HTH domain